MSWEHVLKTYGGTKESEAIETVKTLNKVNREAGWNFEYYDLLNLTNIMANELKREESPELMDIMIKLDAAINDIEEILIETRNYFEKNEIDGIYWQRI